MTYKKKLIEVALPLEAINAASAREKSIRHGHPSTLHLWWARRPLAAARAVIFAQMVDDPSAHPDIFKTEKAQEKERQRLFRIIEQLVQWENTTNEKVLQQARDEIWQSWRYTCAENADNPRAKELFDRHKLPAFHDPFAGGGSLPLEAQRLGLEAYASDLNPVSVLICKAVIEIPPKFAGKPPVNPKSWADDRLIAQDWGGARGLAEDVRYYGNWMRDEAEKRIGRLYPKVEITAEVARDRPDLKSYVGRKLTVIAWLWARTVKSPNPAFSDVDVPLASTFMLSTRPGHEAYVEPIIEAGGYRFAVRVGKPKDAEATKNGTKLARANFVCLMSGAPIPGNYIKAEGMARRMGARLMAIVADGAPGRVYLPPIQATVTLPSIDPPEVQPDVVISGSTQYLGVKPYGIEEFSQLFTPRQLLALSTLSSLVQSAREQVKQDAARAGLSLDHHSVNGDGTGADAYADAVSVYLACAMSKVANIGSSIATWMNDRGAFRETFARQAIQMTWDYAEANPLADLGGSLEAAIDKAAMALDFLPTSGHGIALQADASVQSITSGKVVSTDPPYYDNVPYADLSDFFYVWLRPTLRVAFPDLFATVAVPKEQELVAFAYRHKNDKAEADRFFLDGMTRAMQLLAEHAHPAFPVPIFYAFKQSENDGSVSTGWETFLESVIRAGFALTGTWPIRTEGSGRIRAMDSNALASSIVLVCRKRESTAPTASRREFVEALKAELPQALVLLQAGNIAPVDLQQAIIGPGMAAYTRYAKVLDAEGKSLPVRDALSLINQVLDETLAKQEGNFDSDSQWALIWFEQQGFTDGPYGVAEVLSTSKNTSIERMVDAGFLKAGRGKVRLLTPSELSADWDLSTDPRLGAWEVVSHLVRALESDGEAAAAALVAKLGTRAEGARQLAYRLYTICERKKRSAEAMSYNALVQSWPEITRLAQGGAQNGPAQAEMFAEVSE